MDRSTTPSTYKEGLSPHANPLNTPAGAKVDTAARSSHETTDKISDAASGGIERARYTAHRAVDGAASTAHSTANYASSMIDQANAYHEKYDKSFLRWQLPSSPPPDLDLTAT